MLCSYKLSESEVVKAMQLHGRGSNITLAVLVIIGFAFVLIALLTKYKALGFVAVAGGIIGYFSVQFILTPIKAKKQYRQHRALRSEITMSLTENGINFASESGESRLQWSDIHRWKLGNGIYLLYITSNMFHIIPARAISKKNEFDELLNTHIGAKCA